MPRRTKHSILPGDIKFEEVKAAVNKGRAKSAPGPSGITYLVYKRCPKLLKRLWKLLKVIWKNQRVPKEWNRAEGIYVPKEEHSSGIDQFRSISLLCVEGKIFYSIIARRMTTFLLKNNYIDTAVQKAGIPGYSGCLEHNSVLTELIKTAKEGKGNIAIVWLDLANAYGSVPHRLIEKAMIMYHIPEKVQDIVLTYYNNIQVRFTTRQFTTDFQRVEKGIVTGCTVSVILFVMAINILLKTAMKECRGPKSLSGIRQPSSRAFMDDMTVITEKAIGVRWILRKLEVLIEWARMRFKAKKSRSLVIIKGKVDDSYRFNIQGEPIPSISSNAIKCLGKWYEESLNDKNSINRFEDQVKKGLKAIDKCELPGKYKVWSYQFGLLPRLKWPMMLYEIPITTMEKVERGISQKLRKWLGVPRSFSSVNLYSTTSKMQLPIKSVTEEYKVTKVSAYMSVRDSSDEKVSKAGVTFKTGTKWKTQQAVQEAESRLRHADVVGKVCKGRQGIGYTKERLWNQSTVSERRDLVKGEVRKGEEECRNVKAVSMAKQGRWTKWEEVMERRLTWNDIMKTEPYRLKFALKSVTDLLPTPSNLVLWGMKAEATCELCSKYANLKHILSSCSVALSQGRYRWRHDQVLKELARVVDSTRLKKTTAKVYGNIKFVKEGARNHKNNKTIHKDGASILSKADDWKIDVDLHKKLVFPQNIVTTSLRPDIVLHSLEAKTVLIIELTVPWEENIEEAYERKQLRYDDLRHMCIKAGWDARCYPVEVGVRGFPAKSVNKLLANIGVYGKEKKLAIKQLAEAAEKRSNWIWLKSGTKEWLPR